MQQFLDFKTIEEITEKIIDYRGKTPPKTDRGIKLLTAKVIKDGYILDGKHEYISEETYPEWMTRGFPKKGDVLITTEAPLGEVALLRTNEKVALAQRVILLRGKPNLIDQTYYMYALKTSFVQEQLRARSVSTTVAGIKQSELVEVKIPLLPIAEQKRIAAIAQKCDRLRRTRRYTQQLSDSYLRSVFLEMFGDPVTNTKGWSTVRVAEIGKVETGNTPSREVSEYYGDYIEWIKSDNILDGEIFLSKAEEKLSEHGLKVCRSVESGSILVTCIAGSIRSIGTVAFANRKVAFNQQINAVTPNRDIHPLFLYGLFLYCKPLVQRHATSSMKRIITKSKFEELLVFNPPLPLQEKFAQIVQRFERLRAQQREADRQAEHLFQTVLHRAFRGEL